MLSIIYVLLGLNIFVQALVIDNAFRYPNLVLGLVILVVGLIYPRIVKPKVVTFDDSGITQSRTRHGNPTIAWNQIAYIEASTLNFRIYTKDSELFTIDLGNLTFEQHRTLKPKIIDFAHSKSVDVRIL